MLVVGDELQAFVDVISARQEDEHVPRRLLRERERVSLVAAWRRRKRRERTLRWMSKTVSTAFMTTSLSFRNS